MKTLLFTGLASAVALLPATAQAAPESGGSTTVDAAPVDLGFMAPAALAGSAEGAKKAMTRMGGHRMGGHKMGGMKRMGGHHVMRGGHRIRDGHRVRMGKIGHRRGYKRPHRGFRLPRTFIQPSFFIANYGYYGLRQPSYGYGWSRYYDDAVLTDRRGVVYDSVSNIDWDRYSQGYDDGYRAARADYDNSVFMQDDRVIATPSGATGVRAGTTTYEGDWDGAYQPDGSYRGDWQGTYRDATGTTYEGQYSGTFIGDGDVRQTGAGYTDARPHWDTRPAEPAPRYDERPLADRDYDNERYDELAYLERCRKSSGLGGAAIGGAVGALAGNRIAGRGNRLGGSLIGGGLGAVAGAAIEQSQDRCRRLLKKYGGRPQYREEYRRAPQQRYHAQRRYPSGWQGHYYPGYYYPAYYYPQVQPTVTTVVIHSEPVTTTTTTTYIEEEVIHSRPKAKKRWKPKPKKVWKPRPKPAPVLKGCQQERCLYDD